LKQVLLELNKELFDGNYEVREYLNSRVNGARDVLMSKVVDFRVTPHEVRVIFTSSEAARKGAPRTIVTGTLEGRPAKVKVGAEVPFHYASISRYRIKCTCDDSFYLALTAGKVLESLDRRFRGKGAEILARYTLCKHSLAGVAMALANGTVSLSDKEFKDTLKIAMLAIYLRAAKKPDPEKVRNLASLITSRHKV
jgi:hypothetical protein